MNKLWPMVVLLTACSSANTETMPTGTTVLPLGDSITWGYGSSDGGGYRVELFRRAVEAGKHFTFVGSQVHGPATVDGASFPPENEGHPGWTIGHVDGTGDITSLVDSGILEAYPADVILLMIGTNDISNGYATESAPDRLRALLDKVTAARPAAKVFVAKIPPVASGTTSAAIEGYNKALDVGPRVTVVDMWSTFVGHPHYDTEWLADAVHPNDAGYAAMGAAWYEAIEGDL